MGSGLNSRNPMVYILDDSHVKAKKARFAFVKYALITGIINTVVCATVFIILNSYIRAGVHFLSMGLIFFYIINDTIKKLNLKTISSIVFDNLGYINHTNQEEVYNVTMQLSKMIGFLDGRRSMINIIHLISVISILVTSIEYVIGGVIS